jgi:polysaccharide biosynthesis protein PslH
VAALMARILFVTSRLPYPPREGHQLRSWHLLRAAAQQHEVDLLSLRRPDDAPLPAPELQAVVRRLVCEPLPALRDAATVVRMMEASARGGAWLPARYVTPGLRRQFRALAAGSDLVHLDILAVAALQAELDPATPVVLNEHNVECELLAARSQIETSAWRSRLWRWQARRLRLFEAAACRRAARVLACSAADAARLQSLAPRSLIDVVPNGVDLAAFAPDPAVAEAPDTLVFVGNLGWFPNRDGVEHFLERTLPRIREQRPARLTVVGHRAGVEAPPGIAAAVDFPGFVDDLRATVLRAAVYVVPLRAGSGTRLKLLEAMAMAKAIVSTPIGAEGLGLIDGENALLADTPETFAAAVCRLLDDPALRARLGRAARALAERRFGWDAIGLRLCGIYDEVLGAAPRLARPAE